MGEAHKPTCSRRGSKGPVRREGAKGKRARDAATPPPRPPPRPRSSGDTQTARGAGATARARNARQTRSWRQTFAAAQFREQLPDRRPVTWRTPAVEVADPAPRARATNVWLQEESQS